MIAIDTNVLLRYLLDDDPTQATRAARLIRSRVPVLVTDVVLVETLWTLKGKKYGASQNDLVTVLSRLLQEPNLAFEDVQAIWRATQEFRRSQADFADTLIVCKAHSVAGRWGETLDGVYTFDRQALAIPGTLPA